MLITNKHPKSLFFNGKSAIEAKISDHNMLINGETLFFNMMMQGRWNDEKNRFNNGFAIEEDHNLYKQRISNTVHLLAETIWMNPHITAIGLAEAPITTEEFDGIRFFINETKKYPSLNPFQPSITKEHFTRWGLATFTNNDRYAEITELDNVFSESMPTSKDRVQIFELTTHDNEQLRLINLHLPYDIAKSKDSGALINFSKQLFQDKKPTLVMGDFNIDPRKIHSELHQVGTYSQEKNNLQVICDENKKIMSTSLEMVDAIIKSTSLNLTNKKYMDGSSTNASLIFMAHQKISGIIEAITMKRHMELMKRYMELFKQPVKTPPPLRLTMG